MKRRGFSVKVFLPDGDPEGLKVVEKSNWTGKGLVIPRPIFGGARSREEMERPGVYLLVGPSTDSDLPLVYIGEGDPVRPRLEQHFKEKDFWTHAVMFISFSKDQNLNKAHIQYLEARLVELARKARRCNLDNGNCPQPPSLSELDTAEVEGFLDDMRLCLPILGFTFFEAAPETPENHENTLGTIKLIIKGKGVEAYGYEQSNGFIVLNGSNTVNMDKETPSLQDKLRKMRRNLVNKEVLAKQGEVYMFIQNYSFTSPSAAAGVVLGKSVNGRDEWKTEDGRTLKSIQDEKIKQPMR